MDRGPDRVAATAQLLWAAAKPTPDPAAVLAAVDAGADLDEAAIGAWSRRVGPLFWRAMQAADLTTAISEQIVRALRNDVAVRRCQEELLLPEALRLIVGPLTEAGFEPLLFKGPAIARLYPEPGLRPMDDIDVILPPAQYQAALAGLRHAGWVDVEDRPGDHYDTYLLHQRVPDLPLELHRDLATRGERSNRLRGEDLWNLRRPGECFGARAYVLPPEEDLVALAAHAAKPFHNFERLIWSVDFAVVIQSTTLDWDRVAAFARRNACSTALAVSLRNAARLGAEVPAELCVIKGGAARLAALEPVLDPRWTMTEVEPGVKHRLRYALSDGRASRASLLAGEVFAKGPLHAPGKAIGLTRLAVRQWRRLRRR
ncbi:MAG TPA: nucleotidyltransferase family protein [Acidimicrobiales bacterium]|nr:nucleotidyltransferase family protein [Acidimicrobiales bacterium]